MSKPFDPADWYWFVAGDETRAYASARKAFVDVGDAAFRAWSTAALPSRIASEAELRDVLAAYGRTLLPGDPPPPAPRDLAAELDALKANVARAKAIEDAAVKKGVLTRAEVDAEVKPVSAEVVRG